MIVIDRDDPRCALPDDDGQSDSSGKILATLSRWSRGGARHIVGRSAEPPMAGKTGVGTRPAHRLTFLVASPRQPACPRCPLSSPRGLNPGSSSELSEKRRDL